MIPKSSPTGDPFERELFRVETLVLSELLREALDKAESETDEAAGGEDGEGDASSARATLRVLWEKVPVHLADALGPAAFARAAMLLCRTQTETWLFHGMFTPGLEKIVKDKSAEHTLDLTQTVEAVLGAAHPETAGDRFTQLLLELLNEVPGGPEICIASSQREKLLLVLQNVAWYKKTNRSDICSAVLNVVKAHMGSDKTISEATAQLISSIVQEIAGPSDHLERTASDDGTDPASAANATNAAQDQSATQVDLENLVQEFLCQFLQGAVVERVVTAGESKTGFGRKCVHDAAARLGLTHRASKNKTNKDIVLRAGEHALEES